MARDQGDVWFVAKPIRNDLHPTMKAGGADGSSDPQLEQVSLAPGAAFGAGSEGHLQLCFAATLPILERLAEFLTSG